ncbi:uncharacterized protein PITG_05255 [Phytophthora infestans T30-4]|uniref:Uncharacterized protein n=1 Tax=Phytophthora infestans (strain T30-4) TaxID=403677 RepID=D0N3X2_PHYIT|nr:uncharacterized protein PITG_05255 [Phytophthora infestans T30-4]EEY69076.1 hypothetical protein PITG_05255 [Phytophthora infestans T30-4]|eukprot:XP_002998930.1 hypothetical protein PITG_05255 [Phytophthora infestans T30-4]
MVMPRAKTTQAMPQTMRAPQTGLRKTSTMGKSHTMNVVVKHCILAKKVVHIILSARIAPWSKPDWRG